MKTGTIATYLEEEMRLPEMRERGRFQAKPELAELFSISRKTVRAAPPARNQSGVQENSSLEYDGSGPQSEEI